MHEVEAGCQTTKDGRAILTASGLVDRACGYVRTNKRTWINAAWRGGRGPRRWAPGCWWLWPRKAGVVVEATPMPPAAAARDAPNVVDRSGAQGRSSAAGGSMMDGLSVPIVMVVVGSIRWLRSAGVGPRRGRAHTHTSTLAETV